MSPILLGQLRHLLTFGGGVLTSYGVISQSSVEPLVGALTTLIGLAWSAWSNRSR